MMQSEFSREHPAKTFFFTTASFDVVAQTDTSAHAITYGIPILIPLHLSIAILHLVLYI